MESRQHYIDQARRFLDEVILRLEERGSYDAECGIYELPPRRPHALDHTGATRAYRVKVDLRNPGERVFPFEEGPMYLAGMEFWFARADDHAILHVERGVFWVLIPLPHPELNKVKRAEHRQFLRKLGYFYLRRSVIDERGMDALPQTVETARRRLRRLYPRPEPTKRASWLDSLDAWLDEHLLGRDRFAHL